MCTNWYTLPLNYFVFKNETLVQTPSKNYTSRDYLLLFHDLGFSDLIPEVTAVINDPDLKQFEHPGVNSFVAYGFNLDTPGIFPNFTNQLQSSQYDLFIFSLFFIFFFISGVLGLGSQNYLQFMLLIPISFPCFIISSVVWPTGLHLYHSSRARALSLSLFL